MGFLNDLIVISAIAGRNFSAIGTRRLAAFRHFFRRLNRAARRAAALILPVAGPAFPGQPCVTR
jgi:hypothetical protein